MPKTAGTSMPTVAVVAKVPVEHVKQLDEAATADYSNRATIVRRIIAEWAERKRRASAETDAQR